ARKPGKEAIWSHHQKLDPLARWIVKPLVVLEGCLHDTGKEECGLVVGERSGPRRIGAEDVAADRVAVGVVHRNAIAEVAGNDVRLAELADHVAAAGDGDAVLAVARPGPPVV